MTEMWFPLLFSAAASQSKEELQRRRLWLKLLIGHPWCSASGGMDRASATEGEDRPLRPKDKFPSGGREEARMKRDNWEKRRQEREPGSAVKGNKGWHIGK